MRYSLTSTIKKSGGASLCIYIPASWGLAAGTPVSVDAMRADMEDGPVFSYISTIRQANSSGGHKLPIPKIFGLNLGNWVTVTITPFVAQTDDESHA